MRVRPRRAMPAPIAVRVARVAGPAVAAGALITTVAVTAWPSSTGSLQAVPLDSSASVVPSVVAPSSSAAEAARATKADRGTRSETRPSLTAADEKAVMVESAQQQAAEDEAAEAKAAKKKARPRRRPPSSNGQCDRLPLHDVRREAAEDAQQGRQVRRHRRRGEEDQGHRDRPQGLPPGRRGRQGPLGHRRLPEQEEAVGDSAGISNASCSKSSGIESGLVSNGVKVYRAMCAAFPEVSSFGGRRGSNDFHGSGQAVDAMISDSPAGWRLANWVRANASKLGVSEVIYSQKIWTVQRSGEGWRGDVRPRVVDRQPLRPRARLRLLIDATRPRGADRGSDAPL